MFLPIFGDLTLPADPFFIHAIIHAGVTNITRCVQVVVSQGRAKA